jgi:hypothetical protein
MTKDRILVYALRCAVKSSSFSGRSLSAFNEKDVDMVRGLISQDARYTVEELVIIGWINSSAVLQY